MTSGESIADNKSDGSNFVRPSLTLKERHDKLLDELQAARYGSRSEAVRAAIESLAQSVMGDGETGIEQLSKQVEQLGKQVDELVDQIDEMQEQSPAGPADSSAHSRNRSGADPDVPAIETTESQGSAELQGEIYTFLSEQGSMTVTEIADAVNEDPLDVHESLTTLVESRDFVMCTEHAGTPRYEIKQPNSN